MAAVEVRGRAIAIGRFYGWLWRTKLEHSLRRCYISISVDKPRDGKGSEPAPSYRVIHDACKVSGEG